MPPDPPACNPYNDRPRRQSRCGRTAWTQTPSWLARALRDSSPPPNLADAGPPRHHPRSGAGGLARRPGVLVVRRTVLRQFPRAAPAAHPRQPRSRLAGLARLGRLRPRRGSLAAPLGRGLCGFRGGREARVAAPAGPEDFPDRRLGRARRISRDRPRQFGAALSCDLGHRAWRDRAVRTARARCRKPRPRVVPLPPSRHRADEDRRRQSTACGATCWSRAMRSAASQARAGWPVRSRSPRRPSSSRRAASAATTSWCAGIGQSASARRRANMISGRARACRRADARCRARERRAASSMPTACGITRKASRTTRRSGVMHGIRILSGPSPLWLDARGKRLPVPLFPGFDSLGALAAHHARGASIIRGSC